jgi:hypothetical protein
MGVPLTVNCQVTRSLLTGSNSTGDSLPLPCAQNETGHALPQPIHPTAATRTAMHGHARSKWRIRSVAQSCSLRLPNGAIMSSVLARSPRHMRHGEVESS